MVAHPGPEAQPPPRGTRGRRRRSTVAGRRRTRPGGAPIYAADVFSLPSGSGLVLRRLAIAGAVALGLARPSLETGSVPERLVVVADASASRGGFVYRAPDEGVLETFLVADGVVAASQSGREGATLSARDRSRLGDGLRAAGSLLGAEPGVVRLSTDGRDTEGDVVAAAAALAAAGHRVFVEPTEPAPADVALVEVAVRSAAADVGPVEVRARVESSVDGRVRLALRRDGAERAARDVEVSAGRPVDVVLVDPARRATDHAYVVELVPADGTPDDERANDRVAVEVPTARPRVGVVGAGWRRGVGGAGPIVAAVDRLDDVDFDAIDLLVLSDVPERAVRGASLAPLARFVASGGVLLVLGGEDAYGLGGVGGTPYEALLPLRPRRDDAERVAAVVALDRSGSTGEAAGNASAPIADLRAAVRALARSLPARTSLRVLPFSDATDAPLPAAGPLEAGDRAGLEALLATLDTLAPAGGTDLGRAVEASIRAAVAVEGATRRRVFLLTDGDPDHPASPTAFAPLRASLVAAGVEFAAVVRGDEAAAVALRALAARPADVVRIVASEAFPEALLRAFDRGRAPDELATGPFEPAAVDAGADARAAAGPRPSRLHRLEPAPDATVLARAALEGGATLPVAAVRRAGAGRVVAYAGGVALEAPAAQDAFGRALLPLLDVLARGADRGLAATRDGDRIAVEGPAGRASVTLLGPDDTRATLLETRRGLYEGRVPPGTPADAVLLVEAGGGTPRALRLPSHPPLEFRGAGLDLPTLRGIAEAGRGRLLAHAEPTPRRRTTTRLDLSPYCFGMAALLFLLDRTRAARRPTPVERAP